MLNCESFSRLTLQPGMQQLLQELEEKQNNSSSSSDSEERNVNLSGIKVLDPNQFAMPKDGT